MEPEEHKKKPNFISRYWKLFSNEILNGAKLAVLLKAGIGLLAALSLFFFMSYNILAYFGQNVVLLNTLSVYAASDSEYTSERFAQDLRYEIDKILQLSQEKVRKDHLRAEPEMTDVSVPDTDLNIKDLLTRARLFIRGDVMTVKGNLAVKKNDSEFSVTLVVRDHKGNVASIRSTKNNYDDLLVSVSKNVVEVLDPYALALYLSDGERSDAKDRKKIPKLLSQSLELAKSPDEVASSYNLWGWNLIERKNFAAAVRKFERALGELPKDSYVLNNLLWAKYQQRINSPGNSSSDNEINKIVEEYKNLIQVERYKRNAYIRNNLGYIFYSSGENKLAIDMFLGAIDIDPSFALAYKNIGLTYRSIARQYESYPDSKNLFESSLHNFEQAISYLGEASDLCDGYKCLDIKGELGWVLLQKSYMLGYYNSDRMQTLDAAIEVLRDAVDSIEKCKTASCECNELLHNVGISDKYAKSWIILGSALQDRARIKDLPLKEAFDAYSNALFIDPRSGSARKGLADIYYYSLQYSLSSEHYKIALSLGVDDFESSYNYAFSQRRLGNYDVAIEYFKKAKQKCEINEHKERCKETDENIKDSEKEKSEGTYRATAFPVVNGLLYSNGANCPTQPG